MARVRFRSTTIAATLAEEGSRGIQGTTPLPGASQLWSTPKRVPLDRTWVPP